MSRPWNVDVLLVGTGYSSTCTLITNAEHRVVIDLAYYHGQSVSEIGEVLDIPVATVKTRMFYARKKLGDALKAAGYDRGWP